MLQVGGGVGSITPSNPLEYIFVTFSLLAGSTIWALIVGTICGIVATGDPHTTEFKQKMDEVRVRANPNPNPNPNLSPSPNPNPNPNPKP